MAQCAALIAPYDCISLSGSSTDYGSGLATDDAALKQRVSRQGKGYWQR